MLLGNLGMLRSAWEDINDTRRRSYAGNQSYKLDHRNDLDNPRLLSPEEEQKVRIRRQKGKGKGKGWQYSWQQQQPQQQRSQGGKGGRGKPWRSNSRKPPEQSIPYIERRGDTKRSNPSKPVPQAQIKSNVCSKQIQN